MALPLLLRHPSRKNLGREKFHKAHHFDYSGGVPMVAPQKAHTQPWYPVFPQAKDSHYPPWLAFDKQVLCFDAHFQETVTEKREETYRIRKCKIYFYLEDDTIQVVEPEYKNSGIPQGTLIHRHRIPLPSPDDDQFYTVYHFNLNQDVVLYSRTFRIADCDPFTRTFLQKLGVRLNPPDSVPEDPYSKLRKQMEDSMKPLRPYERWDTLKQFLEHDRNVLRFFCLWDDSENMSGDPRELVLHYFLADDTIEIREVVHPNSGRDAVPKFLHRSKLPKHAPAVRYQPGEATDRTVLNVFGPVGRGGRYILDCQKTGAVQQDFYKDSDLMLGAVINVWGRKVLLCDCDDFTKRFYRTKYGVEDFTPVPRRPPPAPEPPRPVPPYNGFGSEEDSLCSCEGLLPKPPRRDFGKFMAKDRQGLLSHVLRFVGRMVSDDPVNKERRFIISFYLSDDTISVFEPAQRNLGVLGGKFLERCRVRKPGQDVFKSEPSQYFQAWDLYVGARVCLHQHEFELLHADEYTLSYMERHAEEFPQADIAAVLSKLKSMSEDGRKEMKRFFSTCDPGNMGVLPLESLRTLLDGINYRLSGHEILTLGRNYAVRDPPEDDLASLLAAAQDHLSRKHFENFPEMSGAFAHEDRDRSGRLNSKVVRTVCKAFKLPLPDELLLTILNRFKTETDEMDYHAFLSGINWRENPAPLVPPDNTVQVHTVWTGEATGPPIQLINFSTLMEDLFGKQE
ncbi:EF-hand domain-containing family member C2 [Scleropages formosus]|uniref:EF-hand domain-containing family member C2 n=1 Tax=Scleropages formosus TaxID=113540 RepID=UPI0010FA8AAD|nr:EF-hand domain-containing family member C2 [Scleropages formosus]